LVQKVRINWNSGCDSGFYSFYVGLSPFDRQSPIEKVLIEKMLVKSKNSTLVAVVLSDVITFQV